jgi:hypothetical protein
MRIWLSDFVLFIRDIFRHVVGRMTGLLSIVLAVFPIADPSFFAGDQGILHTRAVWWTASAIAFFFAAKAAWSEQHIALVECKKQIDERSPRFTLHLLSLNTQFNEAKNVTNYVLSAILFNSGAPSVALGWTATYRQTNELPENMQPAYFAGPYVLHFADGEVVITNADLMQAKTHTSPLVMGGAITGRIFFTLPGKRLARSDYEIEVNCRDVQTNCYSAKFRPSAIPLTELRFFPDEHVKDKHQPQ